MTTKRGEAAAIVPSERKGRKHPMTDDEFLWLLERERRAGRRSTGAGKRGRSRAQWCRWRHQIAQERRKDRNRMNETASQVSGADPWGGTPPGSAAAVEQGCTCPVIDNQHGAGGWEFAGELQWWIAEECPLHGFTLTEEVPQEEGHDD